MLRPSPGPTAASPDFDTNYTYRMSVSTFTETNFITDSVATLENGVLSNLNDPVLDSDAVNKEYVDISSAISGPLNSIQYNIGGIPFAAFGSSPLLTFNQDTNTMYSSKTKIGNLILGLGTITNLVYPTELTDSISKTYVDNFYVTNYYTVTGTSFTLSALQMVNSIVSVKNIANGQTTITTASASQIISQINSIVGSTLTFTLINNSDNLDSVFKLVASTGVTIIPDNLNIYCGHTLTAYIITTSPSTVSIYITSLSFTDVLHSENFLVGSRSINTTVKNTTITEQYSFNTNAIYINSLSGYVYSASQLSGIIYRSGSTKRVEKIEDVSNCISNNIYGTIDYIFSTGSIEFVIKNISTGLGNDVVLSEGNGWFIDSNSNMTIKPGYTGYFYLYIDTVAAIGTIYTIGIMKTSE